jgi:hypothetical protein
MVVLGFFKTGGVWPKDQFAACCVQHTLINTSQNTCAKQPQHMQCSFIRAFRTPTCMLCTKQQRTHTKSISTHTHTHTHTSRKFRMTREHPQHAHTQTTHTYTKHTTLTRTYTEQTCAHKTHKINTSIDKYATMTPSYAQPHKKQHMHRYAMTSSQTTSKERANAMKSEANAAESQLTDPLHCSQAASKPPPHPESVPHSST